MEKNVAGKWIVFAYGLPDHANPGQPVTGDAANITANMRIDGGAANAVDDTNPTELEDGYYVFDTTDVESNGDNLLLAPVSATANVQVIAVPGAVWTRPANFNDMGIEADGDLTKVNLCDSNTDMRGTDGANTTVPDVAGTAPTAVENRQEMDSNSTQLNTTIPGLIDDLAIKKNTAGILHIEMVLTSDHVTPATGLTVTAQRLIDSGSYVNVSGTMTETSNGTYRFDYLAADANGDVITWRFSEATADDTKVTFKTVA